jgi:hypothetical protein
MKSLHQKIISEFNSVVKQLGCYSFLEESEEIILKDDIKALYIRFTNEHIQISFFFSEYGESIDKSSIFKSHIFGKGICLVDLDKFSEINFGKDSLKFFSLHYYSGSTDEKVKAIGKFFFILLSHPELKVIYDGQYSWSNKYIKSAWEGTDR